MSSSNYSIDLQCLKLVHTAYCGLHNLAENWYWARDVNGRDRDETETRRWYVSRPRRRDRDHNPELYIARIWILDLCCSCDLDLAPMTFIYEIDPDVRK